MDVSTLAVIIAGGALALNIAQNIFGGGWNLSNKLSSMERTLRKAISDSKDEIESRQDKAVHDFGETVAAIREKIREVELFNRDTFLRRDEFYKVTSQNSEALKSMGDKIEARLERMEAKIDGRAR